MTTTVGRYRRGQRIDKERQVLVARPSRFGNPFKIGVDGTREEVVAKYEHWITGQSLLLAQLPTLRGKELLCYCGPDVACHAQVLARLADDISSGEPTPQRDDGEA